MIVPHTPHRRRKYRSVPVRCWTNYTLAVSLAHRLTTELDARMDHPVLTVARPKLSNTLFGHALALSVTFKPGSLKLFNIVLLPECESYFVTFVLVFLSNCLSMRLLSTRYFHLLVVFFFILSLCLCQLALFLIVL